MIPEITDKRWVKLIMNIENYHFQLLSLKILMSRIKNNIKQDSSDENINNAIQEVYSFFAKNERISKNDLIQIFGQV